MTDPLLPARFTLADFRKISGLGKTATYDRIKKKLLHVVKDGSRTFVMRSELERYLKACETQSP